LAGARIDVSMCRCSGSDSFAGNPGGVGNLAFFFFVRVSSLAPASEFPHDAHGLSGVESAW
jgi:hypothetical protein